MELLPPSPRFSLQERSHAIMKKTASGLMVLVWLATAGLAAAADRWVHIKVVEANGDGERVRINIPLSLAEKVLPTIKADKLRDGKLKINDREFDRVDLRGLLEAVRTAQDNEYVTVESRHEHVRVAKSGGLLLVKVREARDWGNKAGEQKPAQTVDIRIPFTVVNALLSGAKDELDLGAAVRALSEYPDLELVTVNDESSTVRIWIDLRNTAD
jgi:hypothetical protein